MKRLTQIFQALLGVVALIFTAIIAFGRLAWRTIRNWWKNRSKWLRRSIVAIFIIVPVGFRRICSWSRSTIVTTATCSIPTAMWFQINNSAQ